MAGMPVSQTTAHSGAATRIMALALACFGLGAGLATAAPSAATRYASIVVDNGTGRVLEAVNADAQRYPASLTKMMTLYMAFDALAAKKISLLDPVPVSQHAALQEPSKLGLLPGTRFTVGDAILGIVTKSANDAACALGEKLGGSEASFAAAMTARAHAIGMSHSNFRNASGLPDPEQVTTARDMALLAHHLVQDYPEYYRFFSVDIFYFHGRAIPNHDHMLHMYNGADGLKTGYTQAAGHNLVTSAVRNNVRLIGVVLGARSNGERDMQMVSLLNDGYSQMGVPVAPYMHHAQPLIETAEAPAAHVIRAAYVHMAHRHHGSAIHAASSTSHGSAKGKSHGHTHKTHAVRTAEAKPHTTT
jgi:D-alanyl-D-alanine carboxypeptidase